MVVSCGNRHTLVVTEDGDVFSFGLGHFGVLGRAYTPFDYDLGAAAVDPTIQLPIHDNTTEFQLTADQMSHLDLLANCTLDDSSDQCIPVAIDSLSGIKIVGASAGHRHR
jgi:alpha-tubulin suppressor-like RCC1 family protein